MSNKYTLPNEARELAKQLSIEDIVNDCVNAEERYQEWSERKKRSKKLLEYKVRECEDSKIETKTHEESGINTEQLTLDVGDYQVRSKEKVTKNFNKNEFIDKLKVDKNNIEIELDSFEPTTLDYLEQNCTKQELIQQLREVQRQVVEAKKETLEMVEGRISESTKFNVYRETTPAILNKPGGNKQGARRKSKSNNNEEQELIVGDG